MKTVILFILLFSSIAFALSPAINEIIITTQNNVLVAEISYGRGIAGYQFEITYNPEVVKVKDITYGNFLAEKGNVQTFQVPPNTEEDGVIKAIAEARIGQEKGASGSGELFTVTFETIGSGDSEIKVSDSKIVNPEGQEFPAVLTEKTQQQVLETDFGNGLLTPMIILGIVIVGIILVFVLKKK